MDSKLTVNNTGSAVNTEEERSPVAPSDSGSATGFESTKETAVSMSPADSADQMQTAPSNSIEQMQSAQSTLNDVVQDVITITGAT